MRRIASISCVSTLSPPRVAITFPSTDEPAPNGTTGMPWRAQMPTIAATSSVERGNATASGGDGASDDSSRPCRSRAEDDVVSRSPSSSRRSSIAGPKSPTRVDTTEGLVCRSVKTGEV